MFDSASVLYYFDIVQGSGVPTLALLIATIPYSTSFSADWNSQFIKLHLVRTSFRCYAVSKCIVCYISTFLVSVLGELIFATSLSFFCPTSNSFNQALVELPLGPLIEQGHYWLFIILMAAIRGAYAGFFCVLALITSTYIPNVYLTLAAPLIWYYAMINLEYFIQLPTVIYLNVLINGMLDLGNMQVSILYTIGLPTIISVLLSIVMLRQVRRRFENG